MRARYRLFKRGQVFYAEDTETGKQETLGTRNRSEGLRLLGAKNEAHLQPQFCLQLARVYMLKSDPAIVSRTWADVMADAARLKKGSTRLRWDTAMKQNAFEIIRNLPLLETQPKHFSDVLVAGTVATNTFLRRLQNYALDMGWIAVPVLPRKLWPKVVFKDKRGITAQEHAKIMSGERDPEWRAYYEMLWHVGGAQSDVAALCGEDIKWSDRVLTYRRMKTGAAVRLRFGDKAAEILQTLPRMGPLFPKIALMKESDRAKAFIRRCKLVRVSGVSLHAYRYAWAERARQCGFPERHAMAALGHGSKAVHRAYAKHVEPEVPSLEHAERDFAAKKIVDFKLAQAAA